MAVQKIRGRQTFVNGIQIGSAGDKIDRVKKISIAAAYGACDPTTTKGTDIAVAGVGANDIVVANGYPTGLNDDLLFLGVTVKSAGTVTATVYNPTAGTITQSGTVTLAALQISITA